MSKQGEIEYLSKGGPAGREHARGKPFTEGDDCGLLLADFGAVLTVLPPPPARALDLGCGTGWTSVMLARRGYEVVGQDIAPDMIALAESNRAEAGLANLGFVVSDYESRPFREEFDVAVLVDALHHAVDPAAAIAGAWRALRPGGVLVTVEPGEGHSRSEVSRRAMAQFDVTERDMPPALVIELGRKAGFRDAAVFPTGRSLASLNYRAQPPGWWPAGAGLYRWLSLGWVGLVKRYAFGAMVVLRK